MKCAHCYVDSARIPVKMGTRLRYYNVIGKRWEGSKCPVCAAKVKIRYDRLHGVESRFTTASKYIPFIKGVHSENVVRAIFERYGYAVLQSTLKGPDLILKKDGKAYTCEVKSVIRVGKWRSWYCAPTQSARKADDLFAAVLGDELLLIEPMEVHLLQCVASGRRNLTNEVLFFTAMP